jgi:hypothetical protein
MTRQIEDYLRARGVRYFRGHHDDEYFYLVDFLSGAYRGRLNVHLEACDAQPGTVLVTISPDRYYPVQKADRLGDLAGRWNAGDPAAAAVVHGSSDPALVGVYARTRIQASDLPALTEHVEAAVAAAAELFGQVEALPTAPAAVLRDAG